MPTTAATPYAVASLTKTFTATALLVLNERGRLALDDPITKYLGSIARPHVAAPSEVTIRRTLQNVAGFPVHAQWFYADRPERPLPITETLRCFGAEINKPGERYVYSNIGYGALGEVIARASGQTYQTFLTAKSCNRSASHPQRSRGARRTRLVRRRCTALTASRSRSFSATIPPRQISTSTWRTWRGSGCSMSSGCSRLDH